MKVFIVTEGEYSDYHIVAVFTNEEEAKNFVAALSPDDEPLYETWETGIPEDGLYQKTFTTDLKFSDGSLVNRQEEAQQHPRDWSEGFATYSYPKLPNGQYDHTTVFDVCRGCSVISAEHADKVASEQRQAMLREGYQGFDSKRLR